MINWKLRLQNKATLWSIICLVVSISYRMLDAAEVIPPFSQDFLLEIAADVLSLLTLLGIIVDPTTEGIGDSERALSYEEPWRDEPP
ncbi:MAG: phage holin [Clostridia bacterium]|nr:phage holin [Clostridia bacterium]